MITQEQVAFCQELSKSKAYLELSGFSARLLTIIYSKLKFKPGAENVCINSNSIVFTYKDAENLGIRKNRFTAALDQLLSHGFIEQIHQGGSREGDCAFYGIRDGWKTWEPGKEGFQRGKRKNLGYCDPARNAPKPVRNKNHPEIKPGEFVNVADSYAHEKKRVPSTRTPVLRA